jgi:hypothetical protein
MRMNKRVAAIGRAPKLVDRHPAGGGTPFELISSDQANS